MKVALDSKVLESNSLKTTNNNNTQSFGQFLKEALNSVNQYQKEYESLLNNQMLSEEVNLHELLIAGEKARISLELTLQIRNKALEAYQEIMRMQV